MRGVLTLCAALLLAGCGGGETAAPVEDDTTVAAPRGEVGPGRPAPELTGGTLDGRTVSLADFAGRPVLVNVWSSW